MILVKLKPHRSSCSASLCCSKSSSSAWWSLFETLSRLSRTWEAKFILLPQLSDSNISWLTLNLFLSTWWTICLWYLQKSASFMMELRSWYLQTKSSSIKMHWGNMTIIWKEFTLIIFDISLKIKLSAFC